MQETNRQIDLGTFTLYDSNAVSIGKNDQETLENIQDAMIENVKFIFTKAIQAKKNQIALLESLPQEQQIHDFTRSKLFLSLPEGGIQLPRSYKLPEQKILTKWERFAKEKNIKKRKKTGMKYDTELKTQVARWGKRSKKNVFQPAIMEQKEHNKNPFTAQKQSRKLNRQKQQLKQIKNVQRRIIHKQTSRPKSKR